MLERALAMGVDPKAKFFTNYLEIPKFHKVERLLKPPSYLVANLARPSSNPPSKRAKINLNVDSPKSF